MDAMVLESLVAMSKMGFHHLQSYCSYDVYFFIVDDGGSPPPSPPVDARRRGEGINAIVSMINGASNATIAMTIYYVHPWQEIEW